MIADRSILAVIVARGGSKGLPGKNVRELAGRPAVAWSVLAAHGSRFVDRTILSSDDDAIIDAARVEECEIPFCRPASLASDDASVIDVLFHALDAVGGTYDVVVLLQATSPLRIAADIDGCLECLIAANAPACVTVCRPSHPPHLFYRPDPDGRLHRLMDFAGIERRQDMPETVMLNGAVYAAEIDWLRRNRTFVTDETVAYMMPAERSVDIDSELDFRLAQTLAAAAGAARADGNNILIDKGQEGR